jgi:5S rRNA maturation endonuclease (ribonuclease M5)
VSDFDRFVAAVERTTGQQGRRMGKNIRLLCPAHDDHNPSLDVKEGESGQPVAICRAGCTYGAICNAIGWRATKRAPAADPLWTPGGRAEAIYDYTGEDGQLLLQVCRLPRKKFLQRRPDPSTKSGWRYDRKGVPHVLYRLGEVRAAIAEGQIVYLCEGEKDVEKLRSLGLVATCNAGGAGKWQDEHTEQLRGASVVIVADRDDPGRRHAATVATALRVVAASVETKEPLVGNDVSDHIEAGRSIEELADVVGPDVDSDEDDAEPASRRSRALEALELVADAELFHTELLKAYATFTVGDHFETWPIRSRRFVVWMSSQHFEQHGEVLSATARNDALTLVEGLALHRGPERQVHVRVAGHDQAIYLDLADRDWNVVEITASGWRLAVDPPVRFTRSTGTLGLPVPEHGGSLELLRPFVNLDDDEWVLFISWLVAALRPNGPYPVVDLLGEQGAAKSTTARVARALIDPNKAALRSAPRDPRDFVVTTSSSWVAAFDNLSSLPEWLSDALCRLSTGGGFAARQLYTDADEVIFDAQRPVIVTGIVELATRSDLLDRSLLLTLPSIRDSARLPEAIFWERFDDARPQILGALLDAVAIALRDHGSVELPTLPRMADFAVWSVAATPVLGWTPQRFLEAYEDNRASVHQVAVEESPIGSVLLDVGRIGFDGTATELLATLATFVDEPVTKSKGWPKSARALSGVLRRLAPNLRALGVDVRFERETTGEKRRLVHLVPDDAVRDTRVTTVTSRSDTRSAGDGSGDASDGGSATEQQLELDSGGRGDASDASDAPCRYQAHRAAGLDWINDAGRTICGVCRPRPGRSS